MDKSGDNFRRLWISLRASIGLARILPTRNFAEVSTEIERLKVGLDRFSLGLDRFSERGGDFCGELTPSSLLTIRSLLMITLMIRYLMIRKLMID